MGQINGSIENSGFNVTPPPQPSRKHLARLKEKAPRQRSNLLDLKKIRSWAEVGCTREEIAGLLGLDFQWFCDAIYKDHKLEEAVLSGLNNFKQSLRRTQAKLALAGHPGMLIWLGKQYLGQSDKQETKQETTVNVVLQRAMSELRELDSDTLLEMKKMIESKEAPQVSDASYAEVIES